MSRLSRSAPVARPKREPKPAAHYILIMRPHLKRVGNPCIMCVDVSETSCFAQRFDIYDCTVSFFSIKLAPNGPKRPLVTPFGLKRPFKGQSQNFLFLTAYALLV